MLRSRGSYFTLLLHTLKQTKTAQSGRHLLLINFTVSQIILELKVQTTFSLASCQYPPWNGVLLHKLILPQTVQKFPTFHGTQRLIISFMCLRIL